MGLMSRLSVAASVFCLYAFPALVLSGEKDATFDEAHREATELLLPSLLSEYEKRQTGLDLLLELPRPVRSAVPNVLLELRRTRRAPAATCDAALAYLLTRAELSNIRARSASGLSRGQPDIAVPALVAALATRVARCACSPARR